MSVASRSVDPSLLSGFVPAPDNGGEGAPRIGSATLDPAKVDAFNQVLQRVCPRSRPLVAGQIAAQAPQAVQAGLRLAWTGRNSASSPS